jgi:hypothetical protein
MNFVWGAGAGLASGMIPQFLGKWTNPVAFGAAGYILKKPALMGVAGYELGKSFAGGNGFTQSGTGFWE